jgi:hypothetical protein
MFYLIRILIHSQFITMYKIGFISLIKLILQNSIHIQVFFFFFFSKNVKSIHLTILHLSYQFDKINSQKK